MQTIVIFTVVQLINIVISTLKYVLTVKATPFMAGLLNAVSYTVSAVATKYITGMELELIIPITFVCNLIGVPLGRLILDKTEKEKLWVFNATIRTNLDTVKTVRETLKTAHNIHSTYEEICENQIYSVRFFAYSKNESAIVKKKLAQLDSKYYIVEPK